MKLNYFNFRKINRKYLITNELGFYLYLKEDELDNLVNERYKSLSISTLKELEDKFFIYDCDDDVFIEKVKQLYRESKRYLFSATSLHIFVMTNACNLACRYCQAQDSDQTCKGFMTKETAKKAVDIALQSPTNYLTFEFQGGEPLLNYETIKYIVLYSKEVCNDKKIEYSIVSNTLLLNDEMIRFFQENNVRVSTSLDGGEIVHNYNRPTIAGETTYENVVKGIQVLAANNIGAGAIQTTTRKSLNNIEEIIEAYKKSGLRQIFVRPLTPLGYAHEHWNEIGYTADEFLDFYNQILDLIIEENRNGNYMIEGHAMIFLRKILRQDFGNYMELRSPCGAGTGQIAYYYDGDIYTCDEARMVSEMGDDSFKLGNVDNSYDELMDSNICKITCQASVLESLPSCCDCIYHQYCGVCPVVNLAMNGSIYEREANSYRCKIYKGILNAIFERLTDESIKQVFETWV